MRRGLVAAISASSLFALAPASSSAATVVGKPEALPSCEAVGNGFDGRQRAQITTFADGGRLYTYEEDGQKIVLPQPPPDFEPLKASDGALERYAFPPRPSADEAERLKSWEAKMAAYTGTAPPVSCDGAPPPRTGFSDEVHHTGTQGNPIWAGYINSAPANKYQWNAAEADFFQINGAAHASCKSNAIVSSWVGLGGWNYGSLIQAGTDAFTNGTTTVWYEWLAGGFDQSAYFPEMYVYPGDYIGFLVEYSVATETATYVTYDQNTGIYRSVVMPGLPLQFYDGSSGDFVHERPQNQFGVLYPLLNFGSNRFYYPEVRTAAGNWVWLGETNNVRLQMWSGGGIGQGKLLAAPPGLESVNSFTDYYYACQ